MLLLIESCVAINRICIVTINRICIMLLLIESCVATNRICIVTINRIWCVTINIISMLLLIDYVCYYSTKYTVTMVTYLTYTGTRRY